MKVSLQEVFGKELNSDTVNEIRNEVAIVFQNPDNQFIGSTVEDDIAFGLENRCVPSDKMQDIIVEYATKVSMQNFLKHEPSALSGGQKQRVAIAGALSLQPKLLILDEATSMLDPKGKKEIMAVINELKNINPSMTILSITHHIEEALNADEIIILNDGQVSAVLGTHTHVQTRDFRILEKGTAYISDVGMCGSYNSILGAKKEGVISRTWTGMPSLFEVIEHDECLFSALILEFDDKTNECLSIEPIYQIVDEEKL